VLATLQLEIATNPMLNEDGLIKPLSFFRREKSHDKAIVEWVTLMANLLVM